MNIRAVYDRVNLTYPVGQNEFIAYFNDSVRSLAARYDAKFVFDRDEDAEPQAFAEAESISGVSGVRQAYADCIADNILYLISGDEKHKVDFVNKCDMAYKTVWRSFAKGRRRYGDRWI